MSQEVKTCSIKLSKVVLYKHGIGYFERQGKVTGPSKIELVCGADEIDDMLKSLVALSLGGRPVDVVTYDSSKTLDNRLAEFGFDLTRIDGLSGLLAQMKGIPVTVSVSGEMFSGRVIGLDESEQIVRELISREKLLTLYTPDCTLKRIPLTSIQSIRIDDEALAGEIKQQLELLFQSAKKKDRKALTVNISDEEEHDLLIAYSIPCPIWKTSYRLVMNNSGTLLQGMAIVDNIQEEDWTDVQVILISASPISFIQPLYDPVQPSRRTIAAQGFTSSGPVVAERTRKEASTVSYGSAQGFYTEEAATGIAKRKAEAQVAAQPSVGQAMAHSATHDISIEAGAAGEQFEYRITKPVSIPRNSSALLPIVQQAVEGERISLYNERKNPKFPFAAVRFKNTTGLTLEAGPVTIMESDAYAGESLLDTVKPGDSRYLLYAIDQSLAVVKRIRQETKPCWRARSVGGCIYLDYRTVSMYSYQAENLADRAKTLYIEHDILPGWKLTGGEKPAETTDSFYRFVLNLEAGQSCELVVQAETDSQQYMLLQDADHLDVPRLNWLCQQNFVDAEFVGFLKIILEKKSELSRLRDLITSKNAALAEHVNDQERARQNLQSLGSHNERYRKLIDASEDRIQEERKAIKELSAELLARQQEYRALILQELTSTIESAGAQGARTGSRTAQ